MCIFNQTYKNVRFQLTFYYVDKSTVLKKNNV